MRITKRDGHHPFARWMLSLNGFPFVASREPVMAILTLVNHTTCPVTKLGEIRAVKSCSKANIDKRFG